MNREILRTAAKTMLQLYTGHALPRAAAGLCYFLTLSFFPMLICLYTMLGSFFPAAEQVRELLEGLLPQAAVGTIVDYLRYVSAYNSRGMLMAALAVMATSSSAAFRTMSGVICGMRGAQRYTDLFELVFSFVFSLVFLAAIYLAAVLIITGKWFLEMIDRHIMFMNISSAWSWARFVLLFLLLFVIVSGVYRLTAPQDEDSRIFPGAAGAAVALVVVSLVFSAFISASSKYPLVYGSLASLIVMMFWLYICGLIVFLGAALNIALEKLREEK